MSSPAGSSQPEHSTQLAGESPLHHHHPGPDSSLVQFDIRREAGPPAGLPVGPQRCAEPIVLRWGATASRSHSVLCPRRPLAPALAEDVHVTSPRLMSSRAARLSCPKLGCLPRFSLNAKKKKKRAVFGMTVGACRKSKARSQSLLCLRSHGPR